MADTQKAKPDTRRRSFSQSQRVELMRVARGVCQICSEDLGQDWHADHIQPFSKGGPTTISNGQALCARCNLSKGAKEPEPEPGPVHPIGKFGTIVVPVTMVVKYRDKFPWIYEFLYQAALAHQDPGPPYAENFADLVIGFQSNADDIAALLHEYLDEMEPSREQREYLRFGVDEACMRYLEIAGYELGKMDALIAEEARLERLRPGGDPGGQ